MSEHTIPPEREQDVVLARGEKLVTFASFTFDSERQILLLFGVLLTGCGVGFVLLYFWLTFLRRAPRAIAVTSSRLRYWNGDQPPVEHVLYNLARVAPLRAAHAGTDWIALLASGQRGARHTEDPIWKLARGLVLTTDRLETSSITLPVHYAETIGPLVAARIAGRPKGDGRNWNEDALLRQPRTPEQMREARAPHGATLLHLAIREDTVRALLDAGLDPNACDARGRNPLMYEKSAAAIHALAAAGTDLRHVDHSGHHVLALRATAPPELSGVGYVPPFYHELDALLAIGVPPPSLAEAKAWLADAHARVTAAGEATAASEFGRWLAHAVGQGSGSGS